MDSVMAAARALNLFALPDTVAPGSPFCTLPATDHPYIGIAFFGAPPKRMYYYTGCYEDTSLRQSDAMIRVRRFAARMDSLTHVSKWIAPPRSR